MMPGQWSWTGWAGAFLSALTLSCAALNFEEPGPTVIAAAPAAMAAGSAAQTAAEDAAANPAETAPETEPTVGPESASRPSATADGESARSAKGASEARRRRTTPTRARLEEKKSTPASAETPRDWRELTRDARERAQTGRYDEATELLEQAASQLKDRRPTSTQRRTVFGLRARHSIFLAARGETEKADALAEQLFAEVRAEPALADRALVDLARATAERRRLAAEEEGRKESQLPLLALAFEAAQNGTASRERLALAFQVSNLALRAGEVDLASRALDQAVLDAQIVAPNDRLQAAALKIYKARIALAQRDLDAAEASASAAKRIFEEAKADASNRGVAEATLAQILGEKGEHERALELAREAYARLSAEEKLVDHARRQIAAALARVERLAGNAETASSLYREALAIPADGSEVDSDLIQTVKTALAELELPPTASATPEP